MNLVGRISKDFNNVVTTLGVVYIYFYVYIFKYIFTKMW